MQLVLDLAGTSLPRVLHWGADLGDLTAAEVAALPGARRPAADQPDREARVPLTLCPSRAEGWSGWPGLTGHRDGMASQPLFTLAGHTVSRTTAGSTLTYRALDPAADLRLEGELELTIDGVLRHRQTLTSTAASTDVRYVVDDLTVLLPVPEHVVEVIDHAGRWGDESRQQRHPLPQGTWLREQRRGRTGPDSPLLLAAASAGADSRHGEIWGVHLGWSGDQRYLLQRLNTGEVVLGAGEILAAGEVVLGAGESLTTPWTYGAYSAAGLDGVSARLHGMLRRRPEHPRTPRPIMLNTWEAVYFDQSYERLTALAEVAAEIGVERFVVDDGWFAGRRDDTAGLGDWWVSRDVWPDGPRSLAALADHVRGLGLQFGLWFEPEMVNPDSELARAHPDWVLGTPGRMPPAKRNQQVLDVSHPEAYAYLASAISSLVDELGISYMKWDHNRDLADPVHRSGPRAGRPAVRDQTLAAYRLMAELKQRHPGLEIESCSSGGARIDYGILQYTDRVWPSDCIDPLERVGIIAGVATLLPFELLGTHVGAPRAHTTGRQHDLALRLAVALFGHAGIEWDLTATTKEERTQLAAWVVFAKSVRALVHRGTLVRVERPADPGTVLFGAVAPGRDEALFCLVRVATQPRYGTAPVRFAGLDAGRAYRIRRYRLPGEGPPVHPGPEGDGPDLDVVATGRQLMDAGVDAPRLAPEQAAILHLRAE